MEKEVLYKIKKGDKGVLLKDILHKIEELQSEHPDKEVFFDGDDYAICARPKGGAGTD